MQRAMTDAIRNPVVSRLICNMYVSMATSIIGYKGRQHCTLCHLHNFNMRDKMSVKSINKGDVYKIVSSVLATSSLIQ